MAGITLTDLLREHTRLKAEIERLNEKKKKVAKDIDANITLIRKRMRGLNQAIATFDEAEAETEEEVPRRTATRGLTDIKTPCPECERPIGMQGGKKHLRMHDLSDADCDVAWEKVRTAIQEQVA